MHAVFGFQRHFNLEMSSRAQDIHQIVTGDTWHITFYCFSDKTF